MTDERKNEMSTLIDNFERWADGAMMIKKARVIASWRECFDEVVRLQKELDERRNPQAGHNYGDIGNNHGWFNAR